MSRAFVKDDDTGPERLLARPVSAAPNYVTPHGLELLRSALAKAEAAGDDREKHYYLERIETAILVEPATHERGVIEFGASVKAHDTQGRALRIRIVGEDEAEPASGVVSWQSPIAQAFTDHRIGERVTFRRPAGTVTYTIDDVSYE